MTDTELIRKMNTSMAVVFAPLPKETFKSRVYRFLKRERIRPNQYVVINFNGKKHFYPRGVPVEVSLLNLEILWRANHQEYRKCVYAEYKNLDLLLSRQGDQEMK